MNARCFKGPRCYLVLAVLAAPPAQAEPSPAPPLQVDIPFEQFTLPNGLRVLVHTDRKAPIEAPIRALQLGDVKVVDADGKILR